MEQLAQDPRVKQQIKDALYAYLYEPVQNQFKNRIDVLIARNSLLGGFSHKSFVHRGVVYSSELSPPPGIKNKLLSQLRPAMEDYLQDLKELNNDELPFVLGYINQVLNSSNGMQDYFTLLPNSIHYPLTKLVSTCTCQSKNLSLERIEQIIARNTESISLMKQRMILNLLI